MINKKHTFTFLCLVLFFDAMGVGLILPVMPSLISSLTALPNAQAAQISGYLLFAFAIMQFLFAPLIGALSDRFGRRPVLIIAFTGFAIDYFLMALAPNLAWLFAARIVSGLFGATYPTASAAIVDITPREDRAKNFGLIGASIGAGLIFGPAIGGEIGELGARAPFVVAGIITTATALYGYFFMSETLHCPRPFQWRRANPLGALLSVVRLPTVAAIFFTLFCLQLASQSYNSIWSFYTIEVANWTPQGIGRSVALYGVLLAIVQGGLTGPVVAKYGEKRAAMFAMALGIGVYAGLAFASSGIEILIWIVIGGFSGFAFPALQALLSKNTPDDAQGELQGAIASSYSLTAVLGPLSMTQVFGFFATGEGFCLPGAPFILSAALVAAGFLVFIIRTERK